MADRCLISIITVCLNSEKTITNTIQSVLDQNISDYEYIIIDGKSTDKTINIIESYRRHFGNKLTLISEPDRGLYNAMNKGAKLARGRYLAFLNSDDSYEYGALKKIEKQLDDQADIYYGNVNAIAGNKKINVVCKGPRHLKRTMSMHHGSTLIKRAVFFKLRGYNENYTLSADYDFFLRAYLSGIPFRRLNKTLANYYLFGKSYLNKEIALKENFQIRKQFCNNHLVLLYYYCREKYISSMRLEIFLFTRLKPGQHD